ncbi:subunit of TIM23 translocase complex [Actinomortierella wolfii]|nr:subunit of TIM23 translocase complex [Actinomortierella wolfii]KAG0232531.1 subunit of TIM23 translocase complex [Actinomortierella wolfii]
MEPSKYERAKVGAMMGGAVGLCIGLVIGGYSLMRYGPGQRGYVDTLARTMVSSTATFAFFMAVGSVIRADDEGRAKIPIEWNHEKNYNQSRARTFRTPPIVILQQFQQKQE